MALPQVGGADPLVRGRRPRRPGTVAQALDPSDEKRDEGVPAQRAPRPGGPPHPLSLNPLVGRSPLRGAAPGSRRWGLVRERSQLPTFGGIRGLRHALLLDYL